MKTRLTYVGVIAAIVSCAAVAVSAQSVVGKGKTGPAPDPVNLEITGLFQAKYASVGDAYLIRDRHMPVDAALAQTRTINLRADSPFGGQQPVEGFLGRTLPELQRPKQ